MKLQTHKEPIYDQDDYDHMIDIYTHTAMCANFIYHVDHKCIYEVISGDRFRLVMHGDIIFRFKLDEAKCVKLRFNKDRYYDGGFMADELGINGLDLSEIYSPLLCQPEKIVENLSKQDLDNIEQYILYLKEELDGFKQKDFLKQNTRFDNDLEAIKNKHDNISKEYIEDIRAMYTKYIRYNDNPYIVSQVGIIKGILDKAKEMC